MKRIIVILTALLCFNCFAQTNHKAAYERQVSSVGYAGVGVETILKKWELAEPENPDLHYAKFNFNYAKAQSTEVLTKPGKKYLGLDPILNLKDSLNNDVYYYQVVKFEDEIFGEAIKSLDKAISLNDLELRYQISKVTALLAYERESPDMAAAEINSLIDRYVSTKTRPWMIDAVKLEEDIFLQAIGEYCYSFFQTATPASYKYFHEISLKMNKLYPKEVVFIDNQGAYWQAAEKNNKKALKFYKKALKIDPEDYVANTNIRIIQSSQSKKGQSSK